MSGAMTSTEARVVEVELRHLRDDVNRLADAVSAIGQSMQVLARVEMTNSSILDKLSQGDKTMVDHEKRLQEIERTMPGLKELRRWVIAGVLAGVGMLGTAVVKMALIDPARYVQAAQTISATK